MKGFRAFGMGTWDVLICFRVSFLLFAARRRAGFILEHSWRVNGRWINLDIPLPVESVVLINSTLI